MIEEVIQVIQPPSLCISGFVNGIYFAVCCIKLIWQASEELCHRQISLKISNTGGGVYDPCPAVRAAHYIAAPQISVEQGRKFRLPQKGVKMIQKAAGLPNHSGIEIPLRPVQRGKLMAESLPV